MSFHKINTIEVNNFINFQLHNRVTKILSKDKLSIFKQDPREFETSFYHRKS